MDLALISSPYSPCSFPESQVGISYLLSARGKVVDTNMYQS